MQLQCEWVDFSITSCIVDKHNLSIKTMLELITYQLTLFSMLN